MVKGVNQELLNPNAAHLYPVHQKTSPNPLLLHQLQTGCLRFVIGVIVVFRTATTYCKLDVCGWPDATTRGQPRLSTLPSLVNVIQIFLMSAPYTKSRLDGS